LAIRAHPLRRRYGLELALGAGAVVLCAWLLASERGPRAGKQPERAAAPEVHAEISAPARLVAPGSASAELGTTPAREQVVVRRWPRVVLRVVNEHGTPLAGELFEGWIDGPIPPPKLDGALRSDEDGRLVLEVPGHPSPAEQRVLALRLEWPSHELAPPGRLPLPTELDPELVSDLGVLVLPPPLVPESASRRSTPRELVVPLVSGVVVDEQGHPVAAAEVVLRPEFVQADLGTTSAANGFFALDGPETQGKGVLTVSAPGFLTSTHAVDAGSNDIRVTMRRPACFEARFLLDEGLPMHSLGVVLKGSGGSLFLPLEERLARCDLAPGEYTLLVRTVPGGWVLEEHAGIVLRPGANPSERRLDPLDLRGRFARLAVRLMTSDGHAISGGVRVRVERKEVNLCLADGAGRVQCAVPAGARLELEPLGYPPRFVWPTPDEQVLVFALRERR